MDSTECRLAGSGGGAGSKGAAAGAVAGGWQVVKQAGGWQLLRGGMGGAAGWPSSSPAIGSGSGGAAGTGADERKMWRFMGTGRGAGEGRGAGGVWARSRPDRMRRRWPGSSMPMSSKRASLRPWQSEARTSPYCSKSPVYCSRCSARSHSATDSTVSPASAMAPSTGAQPTGLCPRLEETDKNRLEVSCLAVGASSALEFSRLCQAS